MAVSPIVVEVARLTVPIGQADQAAFLIVTIADFQRAAVAIGHREQGTVPIQIVSIGHSLLRGCVAIAVETDLCQAIAFIVAVLRLPHRVGEACRAIFGHGDAVARRIIAELHIGRAARIAILDASHAPQAVEVALHIISAAAEAGIGHGDLQRKSKPRLKEASVRWMLSRLCERLHLLTYSPHQFRHSVGEILASHDHSELAVASALNHRSLRSARQYMPERLTEIHHLRRETEATLYPDRVKSDKDSDDDPVVCYLRIVK
nr:tyrosine-type recombinase/integrase [Phototrophicus methaneseepsis]